MRCAICGRLTLKPAVLLGAEPIGPTCARRANLLAVKPRAGSRLVVPRRRPEGPPARGETGDLFDGVEA